MKLFVLKHCHPRVSPMGRCIAKFQAINEGRFLWLVRWQSTTTQQSTVKEEQAKDGRTSKALGMCMKIWVLPCCMHCLESCCDWGKTVCQSPVRPGVWPLLKQSQVFWSWLWFALASWGPSGAIVLLRAVGLQHHVALLSLLSWSQSTKSLLLSSPNHLDVLLVSKATWVKEDASHSASRMLVWRGTTDSAEPPEGVKAIKASVGVEIKSHLRQVR